MELSAGLSFQSTDRAELGCQAQALFQSGAALPDELLVDILVEAIRSDVLQHNSLMCHPYFFLF